MSNKKETQTMKFIDLCCGIGGFHQALSNMGMECVLASDIDKDCRDIYEINYNIKPEGDLKKIEIEKIPKFNVLCAGFPCQPFSKAGSQNGFNDDRGNIFFDICEIITHHNPEYIILENVRNLSTHDKGNTWLVIKNKIDELNYFTYDKPLILNTLYFNVPQSRERVVILCKRKDLGELPEIPKISKKNIKKTSLKTIIETGNINKKYNISGKLKITEKVWNNFLIILNTNNISVPKFPIWTDWWDSDGENTSVTKYDKKKSEEENLEIISKKKIDFYEKYKDWIDKNRTFYKENYNILNPWLIESRLKEEWKGAVRKMEWQAGTDKRSNTDHKQSNTDHKQSNTDHKQSNTDHKQSNTDHKHHKNHKNHDLYMNNILWSPRGSGVRIKNINYSPTLVAMASMIPIYGPQSRELTPRECARLQSFPDNFILHENDKISYKQFGNAVNVKMIENSARFLINNEPLLD